MEFLIEYWDVLVGLIALIAAAVFFVVHYVKQPNGKQVEKIKQWLVYVCLVAEKELGEKTGQVKLRFVYDLFLERFKWLSLIISFEMFSSLVDEALVTVRKMIEDNPQVSSYICPTKEDVNG